MPGMPSREADRWGSECSDTPPTPPERRCSRPGGWAGPSSLDIRVSVLWDRPVPPRPIGRLVGERPRRPIHSATTRATSAEEWKGGDFATLAPDLWETADIMVDATLDLTNTSDHTG